MKKLEWKRCLCGGEHRWVRHGGMLDQLECNSCDYKTPTYFDGEFYAYGEWNRRNDPDSQGKDPPHIARMREAVEEYDRRKK